MKRVLPSAFAKIITIFQKGFLNAPLGQKIDSPESISMYTTFNGTQKYVEMDLFH